MNDWNIVDFVTQQLGVELTEEQIAIINHSEGPARVLAGPGSGKTLMITLFVLRLLYRDGVAPEAIFVTTFTRKAALNLEERILQYAQHLRAWAEDNGIELPDPDITRIHLGTLHELANDILLRYRYGPYRNRLLMDEYQQALFLYAQHPYVQSFIINNNQEIREFWEHLANAPWCGPVDTRWQKVRKLMVLLNRMVEDHVNIEAMQEAGFPWYRLARAYEHYVEQLNNYHRCDFAHLQRFFLEFLNTPQGEEFRQSLQWVLVDEYQDTNRIQERIYMKLVEGKRPANLVVVGDDDQAIYRFRGGTVECIIRFPSSCQHYLNQEATTYYLVHNFRSHEEIVDFINKFINSFGVAHLPGARAEKPEIVAASGINQNYPAVVRIIGETVPETAERVARFIHYLVHNNIIHDYNQCCFLFYSTRENRYNAGPYVQALNQLGIPCYNPRGRTFLEQEEVVIFLGALLSLLDPYLDNCPPPYQQMVNGWMQYFNENCNNTPLANFVHDQRALIEETEVGHIANILEVVYMLLALSPLSDFQNDPVRRQRLGQLTALLEAFLTTPTNGGQQLARIPIENGQIAQQWLNKFYYMFIGYIKMEFLTLKTKM